MEAERPVRKLLQKIHNKVSVDTSRVITMRGGKKWEDSRHILKIEPTEFSDMRYETKNKKKKIFKQQTEPLSDSRNFDLNY